MAIRIGVPRGLLYFYYYPLWEKFFDALGVELVISGNTSRPMFNRGVVLANDETCLPVKVFYGHVEHLKQKQLDYIFLPRMVSMEKNTYLCPKLLGFPEVVTALVKDLPPVLTANFNMRRNPRDLDDALGDLGKQLGFPQREIKKAIRGAKEAQFRFEELLQSGHSFGSAVKGRGDEAAEADSSLRIAVLGHSYLLYDGFTSLDIMARLAKLGVKVLTPENVSLQVVENYADSLQKKMFWSHSKRILGSGLSYIDDTAVDGVIHLSCFGCGPDSMVGDMVERACRRNSKPFMMLTLDEHTGEAGVITRLEAYIDMLKRRQKVEDNLSAHG